MTVIQNPYYRVALAHRAQLAHRLILFLSCLATAALCLLPHSGLARPVLDKPQLAYHLRWDGRSSRVQVRLLYTAATPDSTVFTFGDPSFGGQDNIFDVVSHIVGQAPDQVRVRPAQRQIAVYHHGAGLHMLSYELDGSLPPTHTPPTRDEVRYIASNERFRPVVTPTLLYLTSAFCFLDAARHPATSYSVQWDEFPAHTPYFFSPAPTAKPAQKQVVALHATGYALLVAGSELQITNYQVQRTPYYLITSRRDTVNQPVQLLAPFFTKFFPTIQDYWHQAPGPYYFLSVLPLHWPAHASPKASTLGGFGLDHGFAVGYGGPLDVGTFKTVIAHETSHSWIGHKVSLGRTSFEHQWFGEGFNDYVCIVNLVWAGMFGSEFLPYVNREVLKPHYTSPVRRVPNDSIAAKFWTDEQYEKLPYRRGFLYAFYLDNQIRLATAGRASLRDCLLLLLRRSELLRKKDPDASLSVPDFTTVVSQFLPRAQVEQDFARYIVRGEPLDFAQVPLVKGWQVRGEQQVPVLQADSPDFPEIFYH